MNHPQNAPQPQPPLDAAAASSAAEPAALPADAAPEAPGIAAPGPVAAPEAGAPPQVPAAEAGVAPDQPPTEAAPARQPARRGGQQRRQGRGGPAAPGANAGFAPGGARRTHPLLGQLAEWHPQLFGVQPLPLKRGIFHDLLAAHEGSIAKEDLKQALALHTRSTRYLTAVASGQQRHDLSGQPVEVMAPEHVHHALLEVFRRRRPRDGEDLQAKLRRRIAQAFEASGLAREDYDTLVRGRDEKANALLDEAFAEVAERDARAEALLRAFEASGATPEHFADMYGMDRRQVTQQLERARRLRSPGA